MSSESPLRQPAPDFDYAVYHGDGTVYGYRKGGKDVTEAYSDRIEPPTSPVAFDHDKRNRLFVLNWPDGRIERFRGNPARHLMVEPDPETGGTRPVIKRGAPAYICICREEREL